MPGTPSSETCSVHALPDQYRWSCLQKGSVNQPGGVPLPAASEPGDPDGRPRAGPDRSSPANELPGTRVPRRAPRRRCDENARMTNMLPKTTRTIHEAWP